jgi:prolipoprotein diacylglyceryl transferase
MLSIPALYIIWDVSPHLFILDFFGTEFPINWYGVLFALAFLVGQQLFLYIFRRDGKPASDVELLTIYVGIATIIGARMGHFIFYEWELLFAHPLEWTKYMITPPFQGLASHGASITILVALYMYSRKKIDQPFFWVVDRIVIAGAFGGALIRLGNLLNSEIYGKATSVPWAFLFIRETDPNLLPIVPRHPTQLYESLFCLFLMALTFYLWKYRRLPQGFITGLFMVLLFSFRFIVEFLKNNQAGFEQDMYLNMGQLLSLPAILIGIIILFVANRYDSKQRLQVSK